MFTNGLRWFGVLALLFTGTPMLQASPLTYQFSGTLNQVVDGSSAFSGTLVYNPDPNLPTYPGTQPYPGVSYYSGDPSDPSGPTTYFTFSLGNNPASSLGTSSEHEIIVWHTVANDSVQFEEHLLDGGRQIGWAALGMTNDNSVRQGPLTSNSPPSSLDVANYSLGVSLTFQGTNINGTPIQAMGMVTSFVLVGTTDVPQSPPVAADPPPVPEPTSFIIFAVVAASARLLRPKNHRHS